MYRMLSYIKIPSKRSQIYYVKYLPNHFSKISYKLIFLGGGERIL